MTDDPALATALVKIVGSVGAFLRKAQPHAVGRKKPDGSFVAIDSRTGAGIDESAEERIRAELGAVLPGAVFLGEEGGRHPGDGIDAVIVDPLDGTAPYLQQLNFYAVSLLVASEFPRAAILHQPSLGTWLVATFSKGSNWATQARWFTVGSDGQVSPGAPPPGPDASVPITHSYLDVSSDVHRRLDLTKFDGKLRARGATASGFAALVAGGGADPRAVAVTRAKVWDVAAGLVLAEAIGLRAVDLKSRRDVNVSEMLGAALGGADPTTPAMIVGRRGDAFVEGIELLQS